MRRSEPALPQSGQQAAAQGKRPGAKRRPRRPGGQAGAEPNGAGKEAPPPPASGEEIRWSGENSRKGTLPPALQTKTLPSGSTWRPANHRIPRSEKSLPFTDQTTCSAGSIGTASHGRLSHPERAGKDHDWSWVHVAATDLNRMVLPHEVETGCSCSKRRYGRNSSGTPLDPHTHGRRKRIRDGVPSSSSGRNATSVQVPSPSRFSDNGPTAKVYGWT